MALPAHVRIITVGELTHYLRERLENDPLLQNVWVRGEILNVRRPVSGHLYFSLRDAQSVARCVMFRLEQAALDFAPRDGMQVLARGRVAVYEREGQYQLYVKELLPEGAGRMYLALARLKERLAAEGLFAAADKRPLPLLPSYIGIVTSRSGAALRDMLHIIRRRCPGCQVVLAPAAVQGEGAPAELVHALQLLAGVEGLEAVIIGRGGGAAEELAAFNDEAVVRAVRACPVPVVSAVGHETDFTLTDLAADLRAPTPSAAAELVVPVKDELLARLSGQERRLQRALRVRLAGGLREVGLLARGLARGAEKLELARESLDNWERRLAAALERRLGQADRRLAETAGRLEALSPLEVLARGYSICRQEENGQIVKNAAQVQAGQRVRVLLARGDLACRVEAVGEGEPWQAGGGGKN